MHRATKAAKYFLVLFFCSCTPLAVADAAPETRTSIELNTHSSVIIDSAAAEIWPHIVDPSSWKQGGALVHYSGNEGADEIFQAISPADGSVMFLLKNVEFIPNERRTIKLYMPAGGPLIGYASWILDEQDGQTEVAYHVYSETLLPADQAAEETAEDLAEFEAMNYEMNKARFDRELEALKTLMEEAE